MVSLTCVSTNHVHRSLYPTFFFRPPCSLSLLIAVPGPPPAPPIYFLDDSSLTFFVSPPLNRGDLDSSLELILTIPELQWTQSVFISPSTSSTVRMDMSGLSPSIFYTYSVCILLCLVELFFFVRVPQCHERSSQVVMSSEKRRLLKRLHFH